MHPAIIIGTVRWLWTWLRGTYHVPQNVYLIVICFVYLCIYLEPSEWVWCCKGSISVEQSLKIEAACIHQLIIYENVSFCFRGVLTRRTPPSYGRVESAVTSASGEVMIWLCRRWTEGATRLVSELNARRDELLSLCGQRLTQLHDLLRLRQLETAVIAVWRITCCSSSGLTC